MFFHLKTNCFRLCSITNKFWLPLLQHSLANARGEIAYHMFTCTDNEALKPKDLMDKITIVQW